MSYITIHIGRALPDRGDDGIHRIHYPTLHAEHGVSGIHTQTFHAMLGEGQG